MKKVFFNDDELNIPHINYNLYSMNKLTKKKFTVSERIYRRNNESLNYYKSLYGRDLETRINRDIKYFYKKITKKNTTPLYFYMKNSYYKISDDFLTLVVVYEIYTYKRYALSKQIEKYEELIKNQMYKPKYLSIFNINYGSKKDALINKYINNYISYLGNQFSVLKQKKSLIEELNKSVLIALKFDLIKPIILLDNLIEKITLFFGYIKENNIIAEDMINSSVEDFEKYIEGLIEKMNSFKDDYDIVDKSLLENIKKSDMQVINKGKKFIFKD